MYSTVGDSSSMAVILVVTFDQPKSFTNASPDLNFDPLSSLDEMAISPLPWL